MLHDIVRRTSKQDEAERGISRVAVRAGRFPGNGTAGDCALFLVGERLGARLRISCGLVAGRRGAVERRDFFSAMDGVGEPRIRRATIYFLSAAVVDAG